MYIIYCALVLYFESGLDSVFFSLFIQIIQFKGLFQFNNIIQLFSNKWLIVVWLFFSILILEMYSRYFDPNNDNYRPSQGKLYKYEIDLLLFKHRVFEGLLPP